MTAAPTRRRPPTVRTQQRGHAAQLGAAARESTRNGPGDVGVDMCAAPDVIVRMPTSFPANPGKHAIALTLDARTFSANEHPALRVERTVLCTPDLHHAIDEVAWARLFHAYGPALDTPGHLHNLCGARRPTRSGCWSA